MRHTQKYFLVNWKPINHVWPPPHQPLPTSNFHSVPSVHFFLLSTTQLHFLNYHGGASHTIICVENIIKLSQKRLNWCKIFPVPCFLIMLEKSWKFTQLYITCAWTVFKNCKKVIILLYFVTRSNDDPWKSKWKATILNRENKTK